MILIAGGSGRLGTEVVQALHADGVALRVLTRSPGTADRLRDQGVDVVVGDVRDRAVADRAVAGCTALVSAITGFGPGGAGPDPIDRGGNLVLIDAARAAGVEHVVLLSAHGAAADGPLPLFRAKAAAERALRESGLAWTIIRPTAYLELHLEVIGAPLAAGRRPQLFGAGRMPIDFVSVRDVAALVVRALRYPELRGRILELAGEAHTMEDLARALSAEAGVPGEPRHVPRPALRVMTVAARPFSPFLARVARVALVMDTVDLRTPDRDDRASVPGLPFTTLADVLAARRSTRTPTTHGSSQSQP
jgi:uncharacterized protein YbjT (DUF2867 family)